MANNTVTVTFKDAALTLKVTPQITASNTVIMRVFLENAAPDYSRAVVGIPPIDTQRAVTTVLVGDGDTTVIGGIYLSREQSVQGRTPFMHTHSAARVAVQARLDQRREPRAADFHHAAHHQELAGADTPTDMRTNMGVAQLIRKATVLGVVAAALGAAGCGEVARTGRSPGFLVMERLEGASGADPDEFSTVVGSDVRTLVRKTIDGQEILVPTIFMDPGRVLLSLGAEEPRHGGVAHRALGAERHHRQPLPGGLPALRRPQHPRDRRALCLRRRHDRHGASRRGRGRLLRTGPGRRQERESPLNRMVDDGGVQAFSTIAEVTFFGRDQAGNEVTLSGNITVSFADYGDPD